MHSPSMILRAFSALTLTATLAACEDTLPPTPKPAPVVSAETPRPVLTPEPPAVTPPPPAPTKVETPVEEAGKSDSTATNEGDGPGDVLARSRQALANGAGARALRLARLAVEKMPRRSGAWNTLGRAQLQTGDREAALESFEKAIELNPHSSYAQNNLGLALIYDKRYGDAVEALEAAVELEPVEGYMWNNLGMAYEHLDRLTEARDAYQKAVELDNDRARDSLARLEGVKTVMQTARADTEPKDGEGSKGGKVGKGGKVD